jgi:C-terminal processing protease CtpA/Prc
MNAKGIIIDIRNYPASFVPFSLGNYFTSKRKPFARFTTANLNNPGEFNFSHNVSFLDNNAGNRYSSNIFETPRSEEYFQGKLVVIVNEETISQAEYTAMAFRAGDNTVIIGSQTQGADGNVSFIPLPGGLKAGISGIGVYYPDGRGTQRIGIVPDIEVKPTIQGIREGRDELLEKAIEIIKNE